MAKQIKLTRYRNIRLARREAGEVLTIGEDISEGQAATLVWIGGADWHEPKPAKKPKKNKSVDPVEEIK